VKPTNNVLKYGLAVTFGAVAALEYIHGVQVISYGAQVISYIPLSVVSTVIWIVLLLLVLMPGIVAYKDREGELASGWVFVLGMGASAVLLCVYLLALSAWISFS